MTTRSTPPAATAANSSRGSSVSMTENPSRFSSSLRNSVALCGSSSTTMACFMRPPAGHPARASPASGVAAGRRPQVAVEDLRQQARIVVHGGLGDHVHDEAALEQPALVLGARLGEVRQHQHGQVGAQAGERHLPQHVVAAHLRHHQVEQQHVPGRRIGPQRVQALLAVARDLQVEAVPRQHLLHVRRDAGIVVRHQHAHGPALDARARACRCAR